MRVRQVQDDYVVAVDGPDYGITALPTNPVPGVHSRVEPVGG